MLLREGTALCLAGAEKIALPEGCAIFINSGVLHRFEVQSSTFAPNIVFSPALLAPEGSLLYEKYILPIVSSRVSHQIFTPSVPWEREVLQLLSQVIDLQETEADNELHTVQLLMQLWQVLSGHLILDSGSASLHQPSHTQAKLQTMMQYIHDHYAQQISLQMIADAASISKSGALHLFQTNLHISPVAYLIEYRLAQAAEQLHTTQKSISSIAEATGFACSGYFCRKFRQLYQMSPMEYRQKKQQPSP